MEEIPVSSKYHQDQGINHHHSSILLWSFLERSL
uniref:Uncharacterized protein n=1 Tax=Rhizophora mucronata TaxID=61149 RepID=A0A2P2N742_RHIMU